MVPLGFEWYPLCICDLRTGSPHILHFHAEMKSTSYWSHLRCGAKSRSLDFTIDIKYAWELFEAQKRLCFLTGLPIILQQSLKKFSATKDSTASLDRIDSGSGYVKGNVQWVHKDVNCMKMRLTNERFIEICKLVVEKFVNWL